MNMFPTLIDLKVGKILKIYLFVTHILFFKKKTKKVVKQRRMNGARRNESKLN